MVESRDKILLLGLGNEVLTEDAVGLHIVRRLRCRFADHPVIELKETTEMGLASLCRAACLAPRGALP